MNNRHRMIERIYHKNPILRTCDDLLLPDFVIREVMSEIRESILHVSSAISRMGEIAKSFNWKSLAERLRD